MMKNSLLKGAFAPAFAPTEEQEAARSAARSGEASLMLNAYAGCAKTTTLGLLGTEVRGPALALAFNKSIAKELESRFASNFKVQTLNGFGYGAMARALPQITRFDLEPKKVGKIISEEAKWRKTELSSEAWDAIRRLVSAAQRAGLAPGDTQWSMTEDTPENWAGLADDCWIPEGDQGEAIDFARSVLRRNNELVLEGKISFDDQVYWPTVFGAAFPQYPTMLVDEAQDLNALNHEMLRRATRPDGRLMVCGDPKQSIYGFRGSVNGSMKKLLRLRQSWAELPLTLTFRCPKIVVERQQRHAPGFRAAEGNQEGEFIRWQAGPEGTGGWTAEGLLALRASPRASLVVLCRNNGPLFALAFKLLREGVGVVFLGREIGKGLTALVRKICPGEPKATAREVFVGLVQDWVETETSMAKATGHDERVAGVTDRGECLLAVADGARSADAQGVIDAIEKIFSADVGLVTLSTIHKAKGLEWDVVVHLDSWRVPSRQAKRAAQAGDASALEQEWNLKYVAETRTKSVLVEANLEDFVS